MPDGFFGQNLQKRSGKVNITIEFYIFKVVLVPKFRLNWVLNCWNKLTEEGYFLSKKQKNEIHHRIVHFWISLGFKFQLQQTILIFWNKCPKKGYIWSKTEFTVELV